MTLGLVALVWLHPHMDRYLDLDNTRIIDRRAFRFEHRWYLWISTTQWGAGLVYTFLMLMAWKREDRVAPSKQTEPVQWTQSA